MAKINSKKKVQFWGTGRRKKSIARVRLIPGGNGQITINKRDIDTYFGLDTLKYIVRQPLAATETLSKYDVEVNVSVVATQVKLVLSVTVSLALSLLQAKTRLFSRRMVS